MLDLLARIFPLMLAAASNPAVVGIVILMLTSSDRPLLRAGSFVAGFGAVLVVLGVAGLFVLSHTRSTFGPHGPLFAWVDLVLGAGMLAFAVLTWVRRDSAAQGTKLLDRVSPRAFFAVGAVFMITDASALVAFGPLLRDIAVAHVSHLERAIALAISIAVVLVPLAVPLAIYALAPQSSERILGALRRWLDRYGYLLAIAVFAAIGVYLLVRGIHRL